MNSAKLDKSTRLQRVANLLKKARKPLSTLEIMQQARVCAVNSVISELRDNGMNIVCKRQGTNWYYRIQQQ